jgi:hypothetical protein
MKYQGKIIKLIQIRRKAKIEILILAGGVAQEIGTLSKCEALSSNPSTAQDNVTPYKVEFGPPSPKINDTHFRCNQNVLFNSKGD